MDDGSSSTLLSWVFLGSLTLILTISLFGTVLSFDGDSIPDGKEFMGETSPFAGDTDDDGLPDGAELRLGADPLVADTDNDGLTDGEEDTYGTSPTSADTDQDGLLDTAEVTTHDTDPLSVDSDSDGVRDGREIDIGSDPTVRDTDRDGLDDGLELELGTDVVQPDTDGDSLTDGTEYWDYHTDPLAVDSDRDTLSDANEINRGLNATAVDTDGDRLRDDTELMVGTDPVRADTDGDGFADGVEYRGDDVYADADPLRRDVFIEVDYVEGTTLARSDASRLTDVFASAPTPNPDGTTGITLHIYEDRQALPADTSTTLREYEERYADEQDTRGYGFHHVLLVSSLPEAQGVIRQQTHGMVVEDRGEGATGSTVMHELGHSLGLWSSVATGIDSTDVAWEDYPSVMNYNRPVSCTESWFGSSCSYDEPYRFSVGTNSPQDHDDWGYIHRVFLHPDTAAANVSVTTPQPEPQQTR
jgi:hypothetical protein